MEFSCLMLDFKIKDWDLWSRIIDHNDLGDKGLESRPHVTVVYGLLPEVDHRKVRKILPSCEIPCKVLGLNLFENDNYDVLHFQLQSKWLNRWHGMVSRKFECELQYDEYDPHLTVAYLLPGTGQKYLKKPKMNNYTITPFRWHYSYADGRYIYF